MSTAFSVIFGINTDIDVVRIYDYNVGKKEGFFMLSQGYTFCNSADFVRKALSTPTSLSSAIQKAQARAAHLRETFFDTPARTSGWAHDFACPVCTTTLKFDFDMDYKPGNEFVCPHCGRVSSGVKLDEAWVYLYRYDVGEKLADCAVSALAGDDASFDFIVKCVDFYAENYDRFPVHGHAAGKGKIMGQCLDEAVLGIAFLKALRPFRDRIPEETLARWYKTMFAPMCELLYPQLNFIHNIPTWHMCFIGMTGIFFHADEWLDKALDSEYGIRNQLSKGFTRDGMWRECSPGYHYYTLSALTSFYSLYAEANPADAAPETLVKAFLTPLTLSYDGWTIPALNDGWYPLHLPTLAVQASRIWDLPELDFQCEAVLAHMPEIRETASYVLFAKPEAHTQTRMPAQSDVVLLPDTNLGVFHAPVFAILKSGVIDRSHMHLDPLSVILPPFADDIGTPGYGHPMTSTWYRRGVAHGCVTVDGETPAAVLKTHISLTDGHMKAEVEKGEWGDLTRAERTLHAQGDALIDVAHFEAAAPHTFDWVFHSDGECECHARTVPAEPLGSANGYEHLSDTHEVLSDGEIELSFHLNGRTLTLRIQPAEGQRCFLCTSPGNPADHRRTTIVLRTHGTGAEFRVQYTETK